jgi:hypothetical protein
MAGRAVTIICGGKNWQLDGDVDRLAASRGDSSPSESGHAVKPRPPLPTAYRSAMIRLEFALRLHAVRCKI